LELMPPAPVTTIDSAAAALGGIPDDLGELYRATNGLSLGWFAIFSVYVESRPKQTWNSISRANQPEHVPGAAGEWPGLLSDFLIFASFAGPGFAAFDRKHWRIWYFQDDELHETDLDLAGFIRTVAREVRDFG